VRPLMPTAARQVMIAAVMGTSMNLCCGRAGSGSPEVPNSELPGTSEPGSWPDAATSGFASPDRVPGSGLVSQGLPRPGRREQAVVENLANPTAIASQHVGKPVERFGEHAAEVPGLASGRPAVPARNWRRAGRADEGYVL
jgi:hypothetical protein